MAESTEDFGGGRTHDEALLERLERSWGYDDDYSSPDCRICDEPILFSQGRLHHIMPAIPKPTAPFPSDAYTVEQMAWGRQLGEWTLRTSSHQAALR